MILVLPITAGRRNRTAVVVIPQTAIRGLAEIRRALTAIRTSHAVLTQGTSHGVLTRHRPRRQTRLFRSLDTRAVLQLEVMRAKATSGDASRMTDRRFREDLSVSHQAAATEPRAASHFPHRLRPENRDRVLPRKMVDQTGLHRPISPVRQARDRLGAHGVAAVLRTRVARVRAHRLPPRNQTRIPTNNVGVRKAARHRTSLHLPG
jgi:hypothetical protein